MTAKQAKELDSDKEKEVIEMLLNLLSLCGSPGANVPSKQTVLQIRQKVSTILKMWMQLRTAIHEGVTTTEMEVFDVFANDVYQDEVMNDIYADARNGREAGSPGRILCTVGMGLKRSVIRRNDDGIMTIQGDIILKANVAFPYLLFDSA